MFNSLLTIPKACVRLLPVSFDWSVIKDFCVYSCGSLLIRSISFIIVPLNMRILTPADFGTVSLIISFTTITTAILGLGLRQFLSIEYFHCQPHEQKKIIYELLIIYTLISLPLILCLALCAPILIHYVFFNTISPLLYLLILANIASFFYSELLYQILQYERNASKLILIQIQIACTTATSTLFFLWYLKMGLASIVYGQCMGNGIALLHAFRFFRHYRQETYPSWHNATHYMHTGFPFIPGILCSWILSSSDRWVLAHYTSLHDVGIYSVADLFAQLFYTLILQPWAGSYLPYIMNRYKNGAGNILAIERENQTIMWISMATLALLTPLGLYCGSFFLCWLIPPTYQTAIPYILILVFGQIMLLGTYFSSALIQYRKHTYFLATSLLIPSVCNIVLNIVLTPHFGIMGCAGATLLSYVLYFLLVTGFNWTIQKREFPRN